MTIGQAIRHYRKAAGLTQKDVENRCGINAVIISLYEHDARSPKIENIKALAKALGCAVQDLIDSAGRPDGSGQARTNPNNAGISAPSHDNPLIGEGEQGKPMTREERWEKAGIQRKYFPLREAKDATDAIRAFVQDPETLTVQQLQNVIDLCDHITDWFAIWSLTLNKYKKAAETVQKFKQMKEAQTR